MRIGMIAVVVACIIGAPGALGDDEAVVSERVRRELRDELKRLEEDAALVRRAWRQDSEDIGKMAERKVEEAKVALASAQKKVADAAFAAERYDEAISRIEEEVLAKEVVLANARADLDEIGDAPATGGDGIMGARVGQELRALRSRFEAQQAEMKLTVYRDYTRHKEQSKLNEAVEAARQEVTGAEVRLKAEQKEADWIRAHADELKVLNAQDFLLELIAETARKRSEVVRLTKELGEALGGDPVDGKEKVMDLEQEIESLVSECRKNTDRAIGLAEMLQIRQTEFWQVEKSLADARRKLELFELGPQAPEPVATPKSKN